MPPKKDLTGLEKLQKKLAQERRAKEKRVAPPPVAKKRTYQGPARISTVRQHAVMEEYMRDFFRYLSTLPAVTFEQRVLNTQNADQSLLTLFREYASARPETRRDDAMTSRLIKLLTRVTESVPPSLFMDFTKTYLSGPDTQTLYDAVMDYVAKDYVRGVLERRRAPVQEQPPMTAPPMPPRRIKRPTQIIDENGTANDFPQQQRAPRRIGRRRPTPVAPPSSTTRPRTSQMKACMREKNSAPWLGTRVRQMYVSPADGESNFISYVADRVPDKVIGGRSWHFPTLAYLELLCNRHAPSRTQDGTVLTAFREDSEPVRMHIAYDTDQGWIVQDESVFEKEKNYIVKLRQSRSTTIRNMMSEPVTDYMDTLVPLARQMISSQLSTINPDVAAYSRPDTVFIRRLVDAMVRSASTVLVQDAVHNIASLLVFLEERIAGIGRRIFVNRIRRQYYLPSVLAVLSTQDKLPEIFQNERVSQRVQTQTMKAVQDEIGRKQREIGNRIYRILYPGMHMPQDMRPFDPAYRPSLPEWRSACVNADQVSAIPDYRLVHYRDPDTNQLFCLDIQYIDDEYTVEDAKIVNPYSGRVLSKEFMRRFEKEFELPHPELDESLDGTPQNTLLTSGNRSVTTSPVPSRALAPDLLNIMRQQLTLFEKGEALYDLYATPSSSDAGTRENYTSMSKTLGPEKPIAVTKKKTRE